MVTTAGRLRARVSRPPSTSRVTLALPSAIFDLAGEGGLGQVGQGSEHLADLVGIVVDGLFAQDDQAGLFFVDQRGQQFGHGQRLQFGIGSTRMPRSAPMAMAVRRVSSHFFTPHDTRMTSLTTLFLSGARLLPWRSRQTGSCSS